VKACEAHNKFACARCEKPKGICDFSVCLRRAEVEVEELNRHTKGVEHVRPMCLIHAEAMVKANGDEQPTTLKPLQAEVA